MKVQYLLTIPQIRAISLLIHIDGTCMPCYEDARMSCYADARRLVEYDITSDQHCMLDSLLSQTGFVINDNPPWPSKGDTYYYIEDDGDISYDRWALVYDGTPSCVDANRHDIGNIFKTEEEAKFESERLKVLNKLKNLSDDDQEWNQVNLHYHIVYELRFDKLNVWDSRCVKLPYTYYFKSKASSEAAIKDIGEDKLRKYVFNVKEN